MRNLQKILALALALIMSFSLVVTANAAFSDEADISEAYTESVNVLSKLEVFKGYTDGSYQPQKSITRAEVAAIIYRIATGDVTDDQVAIYSDWNRFSDVHSGEWWAGYINYCANAEYIKGYGNGKFGPDDPVTGYEALAMILRAVGYGKMEGEFQGSDWAVQTAARANTLKVTKNVQNSALLNSPATRELVAELLFRSILVPTVTYNQFSGYTENDTNLAANLGLEAVRGVVVANEEADLYSEEVLAAGKTNLEVAENDIRTLDIASDLDDIGESRYAYIKGSEVLFLGDTGENVTFENGEGKDVSDEKKFKKVSALEQTDDTEFYLDFGREGHFTCDQRLEFTVVFYNKADAEASFDKAYEDVSKYAHKQNLDDNDDNDWSVWKNYEDSDNHSANVAPNKNASDYDFTYVNPDDDEDNESEYPVAYNRVIRAGEEITAEEMEIIRGIFAAADNENNNGLGKDAITGDVYVGTKSTKNDTDEERDVSNTMSFRKFKDEYINSEAWDRDFGDVQRGEWLKIVDNDNDGKADFAFRTRYWLDEITGSYTKSGETIFEYEVLDTEDWDVVDYVEDYEPAVGDVVLCTQIDNKVTIKLAEVLTDKIETMSFRDETVTTEGGETKHQSEIYNDTKMDETITNMEDGVEYNMYLDRYGNIRAYELAAGTKYALVTEMYWDRFQNDKYVRNSDLLAEVKAADAKIDEFKVLNKTDNNFLMNLNSEAVTNWSEMQSALNTLGAAYNIWKAAYNTRIAENNSHIVLQPAINHLALSTQPTLAQRTFENVTTNVARYVQTDEGVRLVSASEFAKDKKTGDPLYYGYGADKYTKRFTESQWKAEYPDQTFATEAEHVYKYDYIELAVPADGIKADQRQFDIAAARDIHAADDQWRNERTSYVNAVHDTEFYIVNRSGDGKIDYFTDYTNLPKIENDIAAVYAVAENTAADNNEADYWIADVIVIEVTNWTGDVDNISLVFDNHMQTTQKVKYLDTLTTKYDGVHAEVVPDGEEWGARYEDYGFYKLYDTVAEDGVLKADDIQKIVKGEYNDYGIYAGTVARTSGVNSRGNYIVVDLYGETGGPDQNGKVKTERVDLPESRSYIYAIDGREYVSGLHISDTASSSNIQPGDKVIWVENKDETVFVVVVTDDRTGNANNDWETPDWLWNRVEPGTGVYVDIIKEQVAADQPGSPVEHTVDIDCETAGVKIDGGDDVTFSGTSKIVTITPPVGYEITDIASSDETKGKVRDLNDGSYLLYDVTADFTLDVTVAVKTWTLKVTGDNSVTITVTKADGTTLLTTSGTTQSSESVDNLETLTFTITTTGGAAVNETTSTGIKDGDVITMTGDLIVAYEGIAKQSSAAIDTTDGIKIKGQSATTTVANDTANLVLDLTEDVAADNSEKLVEIALVAAANKADVVVTVNGTPLTDLDSTVAVNNNDVIKIVITSEDETDVDTYNILIKVTPLSDNCTLTQPSSAINGLTINDDSITIASATLSGFSSGMTVEDFKTLIAGAVPSGATLSATPGDAIVDGGILTVTAENGTDSKNYDITIS